MAKTIHTMQAQRYYLRVSLWNSRQHAQVSSSQDPFGRIKVLSPSLADCLLQRTAQDRVKTSDKSPNPETLEKLSTLGLYGVYVDGGGNELSEEYISQALPYLRSAVVGFGTAPLFVLKYQPKLRTIHLLDDISLDSNPIIESKVFIKFAPQLRSFTYEGVRPVDLMATGIMPRLKTLKFQIFAYLRDLVMPGELPNIDRVIPWNELTTFSFRNESGLLFEEFYPLLQHLGEMAQLRKLEIKLSFKEHGYSSVAQFVSDLMKAFLITEFSKIHKFSKLEVLSFGVKPSPRDPTLNYRFGLDLLAPKLGTSLKKLIFQVPVSLESTSNCILLDYSNIFAQLETLVLKYPRGEVPLDLLKSTEDKRTTFPNLRQLTIMDFNQKTLCLKSIFEQIPTIFPNLIELNLKASGEDVYTVNLLDPDTSKLIDRLPNLRTLRFMDNYPKLVSLYGSIDLMCKRATELKPKVPLLFRVPILNGELKNLKFVADLMPDELKPYYCWEKADKWIRLC